jgi:two-component system response regulator GlrR
MSRDDMLIRQKVLLEVVSGPDAGKSVLVDEDGIEIGSHPQCGLVLSDPAVSRHHAELRFEPSGLVLSDLGSTNGTRVGPVRVREVLLEEGAEILVGGSRVKVTLSAEQQVMTLSEGNEFAALRGEAPAMRALFSQLERVANSEATVLLQGESGTGKELAAQAIHDKSPRVDGPFVVVDCGALPRELIESELFGHERGAFTGATQSRQGAFEQARGGTVFLDEIGELDLDLQPRLLRVIESREVKRLGGNQRRHADIRVVAATHRNLRQLVAQGTFREDLYYRLSVVTLRIPPLRERTADIPLLVQHFIEQLAPGSGFAISPTVMDELTKQPWRGNVRQLRNVIERAVAMGSVELSAQQSATPIAGQNVVAGRQAAQPQATPVSGAVHDDARDDALLQKPYKVARAELLESFERRYLESLVERHQGNLTQSARAAEINRVSLLRLMDKYDMRQQKASK